MTGSRQGKGQRSPHGAHLRQPWLHHLNVTVEGNTTALSSRTGDIAAGPASPAEGLFVDDVRVLSALQVDVGGETPAAIADAAFGNRAEFLGSARNLGAMTPDPVVEVRRRRELTPGGLTEVVTLTSRAATPLTAAVSVLVRCDGATIASVKAGMDVAAGIAPTVGVTRFEFDVTSHRTRVTFTPLPDRADEVDGAGRADFDVVLQPQLDLSLTIVVEASRLAPSLFDADSGRRLLDWAPVVVTAEDPRLEPTVGAALEDLRALALVDPLDHDDVFLAAGTPWYLTLFGRDSVWAARMALPLGTRLAEGTLRALARRQGDRDDAMSAQEPGKILHEVRRFPFEDSAGGLSLPAVYYGTVDATALWLLLLYEAWQWGLDESAVTALWPNAEAAARWLTCGGGVGADGLLRYGDKSGTGLSNQGWKDSGDAVRRRDGSVAPAPIALVEAQAYAAAALDCFARLGDHLGDGAAPDVRARARQLREGIRERFWVEASEPYLGIAIDGTGRLVDGLASNMGHVLGTGCLHAAEVDLVAATLCGDELLDRYGVRTLGTRNGGFNPIGYHTGSIWTHDTAIAALGLAAEGRAKEAVAVARTLLASAEGFDYRWPELQSGAAALGRPAPYPAACRPQAWSAASAVALLTVALGLRADRAARVLHVRPTRPAAFGAMRVEGLQFLGATICVEVDAGGGVTSTSTRRDVTVVAHEPVPIATS